MPAPASTETLPSPPKLARPELLAPAGDWECARAAVENGADAIYFGLERFNARMRARNFTVADLPKLMEFLHRRGVKGYVTFNVLVFANEMDAAADYLRAIIAAGISGPVPCFSPRWRGPWSDRCRGPGPRCPTYPFLSQPEC